MLFYMTEKKLWCRVLVTYLQIYSAVMTPTTLAPRCLPKISEIFIPVDSVSVAYDEIASLPQFIELQGCKPDATDFSGFKDFGLVFVDLLDESIYDFIDVALLTFGVADVVPDNYEFMVVCEDGTVATNVGTLDGRHLKFQDRSETAVLLVAKTSSLSQYNLENDGSVISWRVKLDAQLYNVLKTSTVDAVVLSAHNSNLKDIVSIKNLIPSWENLDYEIYYYDLDGARSLSLNRCSQQAFDLLKYVLDLPSPGYKNYCNMRQPLGSREPLGLKILTKKRSSDFIYQCPMAKSDSTFLATYSKFPEEWRDLILDRHADIFTAKFSDYLNNEKFLKSIIYLPQTDSFRCETCFTSMIQKNPQWTPNPHTSSLVTAEGSKLTSFPEFRRQSDYHFSTAGHKNNIRCITAEKSDPNIPDENDDYFEKTGMLLFWTFVETKAGASFTAHETYIKGLQELGVDIARHFYDRRGAERMVEFLSLLMHRTLVKNLCQNNEPFGILIDSSTDVSGRHGMLVFVQFIEFNRPVLKLYRYLETRGEKAADLYKLLRAAVKSDGPCFEKYFFEQLRSINTDGASNMVGKWKGLSKLIETEAGRKIQNIHCSNHRLELAYNDILKNKDKKFDYVRLMESINNRIHNFYNRRAYKRRSNIRDTASDINESIRMFSKIFKVRWFTSTYFAYTKIVSNYKTLVIDLEKYSVTSVYAAALDVRVESRYLLNSVTTKEYVLTLNHHLDILEVISSWGLYLQRNSGTIIDVKLWYDTAIENLNLLKTSNGKWVKSLLEESICSGRKGCTMDTFVSSHDVIYRGIKLVHDPPADNLFPKLSETRVMFLDELIKDISDRFPDNVLEMYSFLTPSTLSAIKNIPPNTIKYINEFYGYDKEVIEADFMKLFRSISSSSFYATYKNDPPEIFWSNALNENFDWTDLTKAIVKYGLVTAVGNANVEGAFSRLKIIKEPHRGLASIDMVEHQLRIKINTSNNFKEFPKIYVAKQWIRAKHIRSDDPREPQHNPDRKRKNRNYIMPGLDLIPENAID